MTIQSPDTPTEEKKAQSGRRSKPGRPYQDELIIRFDQAIARAETMLQDHLKENGGHDWMILFGLYKMMAEIKTRSFFVGFPKVDGEQWSWRDYRKFGVMLTKKIIALDPSAEAILSRYGDIEGWQNP